jgi:hypothetical protein
MSDVSKWVKGLRNMAIFLNRTNSRISMYRPHATGYAAVMR